MARTEPTQKRALDAAARRRAFLLATTATCAAAGLLLALGVPRFGAGAEADPEPEPRPRKLVVGGDPTPPAIERAPSERELAAVRATAARFSRAFLARESGHFEAAVRRALRATAAPEAWDELRRPVRVTPAWRPSPARFERVSGLVETSLPGMVEAVVAYRRDGRRGYLSLLLSREGGRWRATPKEL